MKQHPKNPKIQAKGRPGFSPSMHCGFIVPVSVFSDVLFGVLNLRATVRGQERDEEGKTGGRRFS